MEERCLETQENVEASMIVCEGGVLSKAQIDMFLVPFC